MAKRKKCKKGFPCGKTCIRKKNRKGEPTVCKSNLDARGKKIKQTYDQYVASVLGGKPEVLLSPVELIRNKSFSEMSDEEFKSVVQEFDSLSRAATAELEDRGSNKNDYAYGGNADDTGSDLYTQRLAERLGFAGNPMVVSSDEIDNDFANGKEVFLRRFGFTPEQAEQFADQFKNGELYAGKGLYGNGTYAGGVTKNSEYSEEELMDNLAGYGSNGIRMSASDDFQEVSGEKMSAIYGEEFEGFTKRAEEVYGKSGTDSIFKQLEGAAPDRSKTQFNPVSGEIEAIDTLGRKMEGWVLNEEDGKFSISNGVFDSVQDAIGWVNSTGLDEAAKELKGMYENFGLFALPEEALEAYISIMGDGKNSIKGISSRLAMLKGFDGINVGDVAYDDSYRVLLNRSKLKIQEELLD